MPRAIALLSGGLDSTLAILLIRKQNIDITAVTFLTHFGCDISDTSSCSRDSSDNARRFGFDVKLFHLADKFIEIVKNPKFGHGKNMNPCIDCRILMLKEAKELMDILRADFIVTGEVLGQRPMSQRRDTFPVIDKEAGVKGLVLRPLSAKLLNPTVAETSGIVDRQLLCDFNGRSRKPQMALATELGLTDYPNAAGGCLLTEPNYSCRLSELLNRTPNPSMRDFHLLRIGRHFRLPSGLKIVVGRDSNENDKIEGFLGNGDYTMLVEYAGSPMTLLSAEASEEDILTAASITARYSDAGKEPHVDVTVQKSAESFKISVKPAAQDLLDALRIEHRSDTIKVR